MSFKAVLSGERYTPLKTAAWPTAKEGLLVDPGLLKDLGDVPFQTLSATMLWRLLGPSASYLGGKTQELTQKSVENVERILKKASERLPDDSPDEGIVPPRVLRLAAMEGAFIDDAITAGYLGGVLASSRSETGRDDRGVYINSIISRLSSFQLRLHFVCYSAIHDLFQGTTAVYNEGPGFAQQLSFGTTGLSIAMGFHEGDLEDPNFDFGSVMIHAIRGLEAENLLAEGSFGGEDGLECSPTSVGSELFLWANGCGRKEHNYFFDREFEPVEDDSVIFIRGRKRNVPLNDGTTVTVKGFDYLIPAPYRCHISESAT